MKLSICMMIKNEEKNLRKCLDSLQPLLNELNSELIIVDTGSTDRSVEIAEKYTNKLYFHEWNDDFSAMRNITINYARGEWILVIDGDEAIENCSNLISFLKSKQSRNFNTAVVSVKNFVLSNREDSFSVIASPRLFRNDGEFHYKGTVHNQPVCREPGIGLQTTFLHYGYLNDDPELMERKFQRTAKILSACLEKDPDDVYYHFQLSVTYKMHHDYREALAEIKKAYDLIKDNKKEKLNRIYIYQQLAACYLLFGQFEKACEYCREGLQLEKEYIDLWYYLGDALRNLEQYEAGIEAFLRYLDLAKNYTALEVSKNVKIEMHLLDYLEEAYSLLAFCYVKTEDYNSALAYLKQITTKCKNLKITNQLMVEVCLKLGKFEELKKYFIDIVLSGNQELLREFIRRIETEGIKLTPEDKTELLKQFAAGEGSYADLNKIRLAYATGDELLKDMLTEYIYSTDFNNNFDFSGDIFYYLLDLQYPLADFFARIEEKNIEIYLNYILKNYEDTAEKMRDYLEKYPDENSLQWIRTKKILGLFVVLLHQDLPENEYLDYFKKYITDGIKYINLVYNPGIIENELIYQLKNDEEKFLLYLYKAQSCKNSEEYPDYLSKAGKFYPAMKKGIDLLIKQHQEKEKARQEEMNTLQNQVKANIEQLISRGLLAEAKNLIEEYKSMVTDDIDIYSMQVVILIMENEPDEAEKVLKTGLKIDKNNFDLLYNLGYLKQLKGEYNQALINYKKARKMVYFNTEIKNKIDEIIAGIYKEKSAALAEECKNNQIYAALNQIEKVLFITSNLTKKMNETAEMLSNYGIDVDLAYRGISPDALFNNQELPYRKTVGILDSDGLVEYIDYYNYDIVHIINFDKKLSGDIKKCCSPVINKNIDKINSAGGEQILTLYTDNLNQNQYIKTMDSGRVNSKDKLTVIIPTYNRPEYLNRLLAYMNNYKIINPQILVLDSSRGEKKKINRETVKKYDSLRLQYIEFEPVIEFADKVNNGLELVQTEYLCLCADDDFLAEAGLKKSLAELEKNNNLFSVKGKNLYFVTKMSELKEYDFFRGLYDKDPVQRLEKIIGGFVPSLIYQVFRTKEFKKLYNFIGDNKADLPSNPTFQEYLFYFMVVLTGQIGKINVELNIRDKGVPRETFVKNFPHAVMDKTFNRNYGSFKNCIAEYAVRLGISRDYINARLDGIFCGFLTNFLGIPEQFVRQTKGEFDLEKLEQGMRQSWVWPRAV